MAWIGIECESDSGELTKWAAHVRRSGGEKVAELLERCARQMGGGGSSANGADRLREVEARAAEAIEGRRARAANMAARIVGRAVGQGATVADIMSAAGMDGWRAGAAAGGKNGGEANRRKARGDIGSAAANRTVLAERGKPASEAAETVARDSRYGTTWEGWAGAELVKRGFKMRHVARGVGLEVHECWRYVSGWTRHWKREALGGRSFPGPQAGWADRLEQAEAMAKGVGLRGKEVKLNGTRDQGYGPDVGVGPAFGKGDGL